MEIKIISTHQGFLKISEIWKKIYFANDSNSFFQSYEWNYFWYSNNLIDKDLFIVLFYKDSSFNSCQLICPTFIDENGVLRFISDNHADYCDVLRNELSQSDAESIANLFSNLVLKHKSIKKIHFMNFLKSNSSTNIILRKIDINTKYVQSTISSSFVLDKNMIFPYSAHHFKSSNRKRINKNFKKFSDYQYKVLNKIESRFPYNEIVYLRDIMVENGRRKIDFLTDNMIKTINCLYDIGLVDVNIVSYNNKVKSLMIILKKQNSHQLWVSLFIDIPHISIFTINSFLQSINSTVDIKIELGRGFYDYKILNYAPTPLHLHEFYFAKSKVNYFIFLLHLQLKIYLNKLKR